MRASSGCGYPIPDSWKCSGRAPEGVVSCGGERHTDSLCFPNYVRKDCKISPISTVLSHRRDNFYLFKPMCAIGGGVRGGV